MIADIFVEFGPRSLLSLAGIIGIIGGVWKVDRSWDEKGSEAYERAKIKSDSSNKTIIITKEEKEASFPTPTIFIGGWITFAISYIFPLDGGFSINLNAPVVAAMTFCVILSFVASVPMGDAVMNRKADKKKKLSVAFVASWIGLTISSGLTSTLGSLSFGFCGLGFVCIVASMKILWQFRKMGDFWEQNGRPNPNPIVYNMGAPLFVFGWFLFWVGMSATNQGVLASGIPFFFNIRTALAFFSGCGMVPVVMLLDYAHDEGAEYVGFGTDGRFFGRFLESPLPFLIMWTLFGATQIFAVDNSIIVPSLRHWLFFGNCLAQGVVAGLFIQTALYKGNKSDKNKWSVVFVGLFVSLGINIGLGGGGVKYLGLFGAMLAILGQKTIFGNRKRGDYWMETKKVNPNPIVYSYGELYFMTGWILLSSAVAIPN